MVCQMCPEGPCVYPRVEFSCFEALTDGMQQILEYFSSNCNSQKPSVSWPQHVTSTSPQPGGTEKKDGALFLAPTGVLGQESKNLIFTCHIFVLFQLFSLREVLQMLQIMQIMKLREVLRFIIQTQKQAAGCPCYLTKEIHIAKQEGWHVEEDEMQSRQLVQGGTHTLATGPRHHSPSDTRDMAMCPGRFHQWCISSEAEVTLVRRRQKS